MSPALYLATALLLIVTLLPLWRNTHWVIRAMDFPRLQFASFALLLLITHWFVSTFNRTIAGHLL